MAATSPSMDAVIGKVRAQAGKRRLALQPFFADFDRLHSGRITAAQFARVLNSNDMHLSQDEINVLVGAFAAQSLSGATAAASAHVQANPAVMYTAFLECLQSAPGSVAAVRRSVASATLTDAEQARLAPVCRMLQRAIQSHGTSLTAPFRDLDPLHTGRVTAAQFRRCLPFSTSLTEDAMNLFAKQYSDGRGGVYYMPWCRAMDPSLNEEEEGVRVVDNSTNGHSTINCLSAGEGSAAPSQVFQASASSFTRDCFANPNLTADELVAIFRQQCALYRIRYEDALTDMDKMKTGRVSAAQFASALGRMPLVHFALRTKNTETLARAYSNGYRGPIEGCMVDYNSFLRDIHPSQALQSTADGRSVPVNFFATAHAADTYITSAADQEKAAALLERLRANIRANRISLSPVLRDFDRVRKGIYEHRTCTHTRFARGLATQNILLPPEELQLLIRKYTVPNPDGTPSSEVNYYLFVQDVDPSQVNGGETRSVTRTATRAAPGQPRAVLNDTSRFNGVSAEGAVRRVAQQIIARRLHLSDVLANADPLRSGTISKGRFGSSLKQAGVELTSQDSAALEAHFASTRVPEAVDAAALQAAVKAAVSALQQSAKSDPASTTRLQNVSLEMASLLTRVRHNVRVHNALLLPFFADFDRNHRGVVTPQQFAQACVRHHLPLTATELVTVAQAYTKNTAHPDEVHYLDFIHDVGCGEEGQSQAVGAADAGSQSMTTTALPHTTVMPTSATVTTAANTAASAGDVDALLTKLCLFLQERRPRLNEFFPDGDELRHQHVTPSRFRHCLSMLGLTSLTEQELRTLESGFASVKCPGDVDYPAFVCTLRSMLADGVGVAAVTQRRLGSDRPALADTAPVDSAATAFAKATLERVQRMLKARRTATITAFREYDRARKGFITDGQFFACLQALGVLLQPDEALALLQLYGVGGGQVHYLPFAQEVDDATLVSVS